MSDSIFTKVMNPSVSESRFNLSHDVKLSFNMGGIIPIMVADVLPGDRWHIDVEAMLRFSALISPVMHNIKVITNFFFVPNRTMWKTDPHANPPTGWEPFITGENTDDPPPTFGDISQIVVKSLGDYLGYPTDATANADPYLVSAFPVAAYINIYNYWFRDENLQPELDATIISGSNVSIRNFAKATPLLRAKNHDYFTSALPFSQKGDAVQLPLLTNDAPEVQVKGFADIASGVTFFDPDDGTLAPLGNAEFTGVATGLLSSDGDGEELVMDPEGTLFVNINNEASTVETLRASFRLQEWLEKNARGGTRYSEHLKSHFNVHAQDARLQNPEYIGGHVTNMVISEVLNTTGTLGAAVGDMAGHGISVSKGKKFRYNAHEHGWIIGLISVTPNTAYSQGIPRSFMRSTILDYAFPSFANLGEQAILNYEIYVADQTPTPEEGLGTFGYIPRYAEYKYLNNRIAGEFRTNLDFWHCGLDFGTKPQLNSDFIETKQADYDKIFAVDSSVADTIYGHIYNNISVTRKLPKYGIPTI